ncbi:hypothetical protein, partial [Serratia marcescens]|uniref:hypothetical protein n=2 Tax=Serratia marcescens TaxID=615 RepID=UPI002AA0B1AC
VIPDKKILSLHIISLIKTMQLRSAHCGIKRMNKISATSSSPRRDVADPYRLPSMHHILSQRGTSSITPKQ